MRVLILGGSGFIGSAVVAEMLAHEHHVQALARSEESAARLSDMGAHPLLGSLEQPGSWLDNISEVDAILHIAASFDDHMARLDQQVIQAILSHPSFQTRGPKLVYTGGCWLYGDCRDNSKTETSPFAPLADFSFMLDQRNSLFQQDQIPSCVVHPGLVWDETGGTHSAYLDSLREDQPLQLIGGPDILWPLIHRKDLAVLYRLAAETGQHSRDYLGVSETVSNNRIATALRDRFASHLEIQNLPVERAIEDLGGWAAGYAMSQQLNSDQTTRMLNWAPQQAGILESITKMPNPVNARESYPV